ncbi:MAG TPA: PEP-CTERM sorting domain-containing protein [Caulobacteraceae bacterium]|jgi:hypothetical protein|nr:PEP-CTERM sorting domain-containing protein [Caulobacteraceae bacterium]
MRKLAVSIATAALSFVLPANAQTVLYSTGFEQGYAPGPLSGQGGWTVAQVYPLATDYSSNVLVQGALANAGSQAVEFTFPSSDTGAYYTFTPFVPTAPITVSAEINYQLEGTNGFRFLVDSGPGSSDITAGVSFWGPDGDRGEPVRLIAYSSQTGYPAEGVVLGIYPSATWLDVSMTLNYATQTYNVSVNGVLAGSNIAFCGVVTFDDDCTATSLAPFSEIDVLEYPPRAGEVYLDDVSVTEAPEPGVWSLMITGVGLVGASLRLRRRVRRDRRGPFTAAQYR